MIYQQRCWNPSVLPARPTEISQDRREGDSRRSEWPAQFRPACSLQMPLFQYAPLGSFPWKHQSRLRVYLQASELDISSLYLTQIVLVTTTMSWPIKFFEGAKPGQKRKISSVGVHRWKIMKIKGSGSSRKVGERVGIGLNLVKKMEWHARLASRSA